MFSWRLVMAPAPVQHYVVAHELAHLRHLDHGPGFWVLVDRLTPHRTEAEAWLRRHGPTLLRTGLTRTGRCPRMSAMRCTPARHRDRPPGGMVDAADLKSAVLGRAGSSPAAGTMSTRS